MILRSRRAVLKSIACGALAAGSIAGARATTSSVGTYSRRAKALIERSIVIDMLSPLVLDGMSAAWLQDVSVKGRSLFQSSGITAFHNAVGLGDPVDAHNKALSYLAFWNSFIARHSDVFLLVGAIADLQRAKATGRAAVIMGIQNADHFRSAADVELFHRLGQRTAQLTYNTQNLLGSGGTDRVDGGVSKYGVEIISKMNEVGMLVDVSHCGDRTTLDAIDISSKPVAITHSNCRALSNNPRSKSDEAIKKLASRGGVMGITGVRNYVRDREPTTLEHLVDHIDHVVQLVGIDHVGIGSDADLNGYDDTSAQWRAELLAAQDSSLGFRDKLDIEGFDHPLKMFDLSEALIRRGYSDADIAAILGGNFHRLLTEVWPQGKD